MFVINKKSNTISEIAAKTFHSLKLKERDHLQEWIAKNSSCLGEELLIIQKEFDGFNGTNERLDLLALDSKGAVVVIENKLDDSGKDVTWQALKYVSYCSTLTKGQIAEIYQEYLDKQNQGKRADSELETFYGKPFDELELNKRDQRIILVSGDFRKEVTSTVMWMLVHKIQIQCFKVTPYLYREEILLDIEQIIPVKEAEEYLIKMADKSTEDNAINETNQKRYDVRVKFWRELLDEFNKISEQFKNVSPTTDHWLSGGSGVSGVTFQFIITGKYAGVLVYIGKSEQEANKRIYDNLYKNRDKIEDAVGRELLWERLDDKKSSRIECRLADVNIFNEEDWPKIKTFLCEWMPKMNSAFRERLAQAAKA